MPTIPEPDAATLAAWRAKGLIVGESRPADAATAGKRRKRPPLIDPLVVVLPGYRAFEVPVETAAVSNERKRSEQIRLTVAARRAWFRAAARHLEFLGRVAVAYADTPGYRVRVRFTRIGGRRLDPANLGSALKACEDAVALSLGDIPDGGPRWSVEYAQEPGPRMGVRVELWQAGDGR